jgi:Cu(I)/Ag(I) efflux system membrane fusion protein
MAFDNRGADWLQVEPLIANPYFGATMLRCGTVRDIYGLNNDSGTRP